MDRFFSLGCDQKYLLCVSGSPPALLAASTTIVMRAPSHMTLVLLLCPSDAELHNHVTVESRFHGERTQSRRESRKELLWWLLWWLPLKWATYMCCSMCPYTQESGMAWYEKIINLSINPLAVHVTRIPDQYGMSDCAFLSEVDKDGWVDKGVEQFPFQKLRFLN